MNRLDVPASSLWKLFRDILTEEFAESEIIDNAITDPAILKHVIRKNLKKNASLYEQVEQVINGITSSKNEIVNSEIEAGKDVQIGDKGTFESSKTVGSKNRLSGSIIKAGGDVRIGDISFGDKKESQIDKKNTVLGTELRNELAMLPSEQVLSTVRQTNDLVAGGDLKEAIRVLTQFSGQYQLRLFRKEMIALSGRYEDHLATSLQGTMSLEEKQRGRNQITQDLLGLMEYFPF